LALSPNQQFLFASGFIYDSNLNNLGYQVLNVAEAVDADYVYGAAYSADGSLVFQPGVQSIDVFDGRTGTFRTRISLPVELSPNFRALISDDSDNVLVAITGATGNGIALINLNSIPELSPLAYLSAVSKRHTSFRAVPVSQASSPARAHPRQAFPFAKPFRERPNAIVDSIRRSRVPGPPAAR
jgi:hypothetical protein